MENFFTNTQIHGYPLRVSIIILLIIFFSSQGNSQIQLSTQNKRAKNLYKRAIEKHKLRLYDETLYLLDQAILKDPNFFEAYLKMGILYQALGREEDAYIKYQEYLKKVPNASISIIEKLAFMAFDRGEYEKATTFLKQLFRKAPEKKEKPPIKLLLSSLAYVKGQLKNNHENNIIEQLPKNINRFKLQYLPTITVDNSAIFFTKRDKVTSDEDIVVSYYRNEEWQPAESVSPKINSPLNEGACSVSSDGRRMIFTSCDKRDSYGSCDLYITNKIGDHWTQPKTLGKPINSKYWESQPSLSADGQTLYFSSNRPNGHGGRDIYVSKNEQGSWSIPINLGPTINSPKDETTPFIHPNGKILFFSSNGFVGMGGFDLYKSNGQDTSWTTPENLGFPINTHKDEVAIVIASDGKTAYFAKEEQKNYEILDSKIVKTVLAEEKQINSTSFIIGKVLDAHSTKPLKATIQVVDIKTTKTKYQNESDPITGLFYMVLPINLNLAAYVKKKGYLYSDYHFNTKNNLTSNSDTLTIYLGKIAEGKSIVLENIYFDFDSYELKEESQSEIENLYQILLDNPSIIVEIAGHTDNVGTSSYNLELSKKRAQKLYKKLIDKGIDDARITYKGYGDKFPKALNISDKGKKSNRRIEFRILQVKQ